MTGQEPAYPPPDRPGERPGAQSFPISLHVPGILRLLGEHLYASPQVALRELIQNAHDSCQRRRAEDPAAASGYRPRIDIRLDAGRRTLTLRDNGSGLTEHEIHAYLATVGRGYTAGLRERLQLADREEALALVGQFGLGLLSAFIVAGRVVMVTRSFRPGAPAWRWESAGEETYTLAPASRRQPGTTVTLHLKLAGEFLLNEGLVREIIRTYADFLRVPITLNGSGQPVNALDAPWHRGADLVAYRAYLADRFDAPEPLAVIPLRDHVETVALPGGAADTLVTPLGGVLFVPTGSMLSVREYGDVAIYVRRMFVTAEERELLPRWARFVRGVVESPVLNPTASREQVRHDAAFYAVQRAVEAQLLAALSDLARRDPAVWGGIVLAHNDLIKGWAVESHAFFEAVCDLLTVETSRGRSTVPQVLEASGGTLYYFVEERGAMQEKMLYEARGLVVVDASRFAEEPFLQAYARAHPGVGLVQLEPAASFLFEEVDDAERWTLVTRYYEEQGIAVRVARFEPESVPAMLIHPPGSDHLAEARALLAGGAVSGPVARLLEAYVSQRDPGLASQGTLHLNAANPLMRRLLSLPPGADAFTAALEIVYQNARLFAGRTLTPQEARQAFDLVGYSVEQLVGSIQETAAPPPDAADAES